MNILEFLGIVFLVIILLNVVIGIWAIRTAIFGDDEIKIFYKSKEVL
jgi:hypothetical protein